MTELEPSALALFWAAIIAVSIVVYVILDGFDFGVGILFGTTREPALRSGMMDPISPFWDGNETWLVIIGASLFAAFRRCMRCSCRPSIYQCCCCCSG